MLDWRKLHKVATCGDDVVPVAVQDADTREMLILAYANERARRGAAARRLRALEHVAAQALDQGRDVGRRLGPGRDPRELRAELLALPRQAGRTGACHTGPRRAHAAVDASAARSRGTTRGS